MADALRSVLAFFGVKADTKELDAADKKVQSFTGFLSDVSSKLRGGLGFGDLGAAALVRGLQGSAGDIGKAAKLAGTDVNNIQRLMHQTGKDADSLGRVFRVLGRNISLAGAKKGAEGLQDIDDVMGGELPGSGKKATQLFKSLGIATEDIANKSPADLFVDVAEKIGQMGSLADRNRAAVLAFGPDGPSLIKDTETLRELGAEYDKIGGFTEENIKTFKQLGRAQKENDLAWNKLKILLGSTLVPLFTALAKAGTAVYKFIIDSTKGTNTWTVAMGFIVAALVAMNYQSALLLGKWALMALPWLVLFAIVEDVFTLFTGGDSLIGELVGSFLELFGVKNAAKEIQQSFKNLFNELKTAPLGEFFGEFWDNIQRINRFGGGVFTQFGEDLRASAIGIVTFLLGWATDLSNAANNAAASFILGLIDGLVKGTSKVLETIKGVGTSIIDGFKNVLGIHSPSAVFRQAGINIDAGAAEGIAGGLSVSAAADMAGATSEAFAPRVRGGGGGGPVTIDARQTVRLEQTFHGMADADSVAAAARDGGAAAFNDDRRALLMALETVAP